MFTNATKLYGCTWESYPSEETVTRIIVIYFTDSEYSCTLHATDLNGKAFGFIVFFSE